MSLILPFKALRPSIDKASDVIAPPYDVLDSNEAREMAKNKPEVRSKYGEYVLANRRLKEKLGHYVERPNFKNLLG